MTKQKVTLLTMLVFGAFVSVGSPILLGWK